MVTKLAKSLILFVCPKLLQIRLSKPDFRYGIFINGFVYLCIYIKRFNNL